MNNIIELLELGAKAEGLRQQSIASNIANLQTSQYRRVDVRFEELLAKALQDESQVNLEDVQLEFYEPRQTPVKANGNDVSFEAEVGQMIKNSIRHKTYVRLLNKKYEQMELAIQTRS